MVCLKRGRIWRSGEAKNHQICDGGGVCRPQYKFYRKKIIAYWLVTFSTKSTRLYIRSLLTDTFYEAIENRHLTMGTDFDRVPGQVLFAMALDACHASIERDFDGAMKALNDMSLDQFPRENISEFATFAQKQLQILMSDFALPIKMGSMLLNKVTTTESPVFNSVVMQHYLKVKEMEKKYVGYNPTLLPKDPGYVKYGPVGSMEFIQDQHGTLLAENNWPATAQHLPQGPSGNATGDPVDINSDPGVKHGNGGRPIPPYIKCHCCGKNHYKTDCPCAKCTAKRAKGGKAGGGGGGGGGGGRGGGGGGGGGAESHNTLFHF
jgi:uncharacterized membrane protein YgcG